jgi:hypothetical protein
MKKKRAKKYSGIEVRGTIELDDGVIEVCNDSDKPTMWTVYGVKAFGDPEWLSDHRTKESALVSARNHSDNWGVPLYNYVEQYK